MEARLKPSLSLREGSERRLGATARIAILSVAFFFERLLLSQFIDFHRAQDAQGFGALVRFAQHWGLRFLVTAVAALAVFTYVHAGNALEAVEDRIRSSPVRTRWILVHGALLTCLVPISYYLYRDDSPLPYGMMVPLWMSFAMAAVVSAAAAMAPLPAWRQAAASLRHRWWYAIAAGAVSVCAMELSQRLWEPTATLTFNLVRRLLLPMLPTLVADPVARTLSTGQFSIAVTSLCSGLEGVGLILAFSAAWLIFFRREYFFPQALALIPAGLAAMFALNVVRIAVLLLIGNAGYPDVALYGFHSQAGWIAFLAVACSVVLLSRRSAWLYRVPGSPIALADDYNPVALYLAPLIAILAAGIVSHAISGSFEYFYPIRVLAAFAALLSLRKRLQTIDWRCSWRGPAVGALVFVFWWVAARYVQHPGDMPERLAAMTPLARSSWIFSRILGSVVFVPLAEELAYRGYLMRRLCAPDFEGLAYTSVGWTALLVSSVVFGAGHGDLWFAGVVAGASYGLLAIRTGRLGEAVVAHAVSNALIVAAVLGAGEWQLW